MKRGSTHVPSLAGLELFPADREHDSCILHDVNGRMEGSDENVDGEGSMDDGHRLSATQHRQFEVIWMTDK